MKAIIIKKISIAFAIALPIILILDFFQYAAPVSIYLLLSVWSVFSIILLRLDSALAARDSTFATTSIVNYLALVMLLNSIALYFIQGQILQGRQQGFLAANIKSVSDLQISLGYDLNPAKKESTLVDKTKPKESKPIESKTEIAESTKTAETIKQTTSSDTNIAAKDIAVSNSKKTQLVDPSETKNRQSNTKDASANSKIERSDKKEENTATLLAKLGYQLNSKSFYQAAKKADLKSLELFYKEGFRHDSKIELAEKKYSGLALVPILIKNNNAHTISIIEFYLTKDLDINQNYASDAGKSKTSSKTQSLIVLAIEMSNNELVSFLKLKGAKTEKAISAIKAKLTDKKYKDKKHKNNLRKLENIYTTLTGKKYRQDTKKTVEKKKTKSLKTKKIELSKSPKPAKDFISAIMQGNIKLVKQFIAKGAKVNKRAKSVDFPYPIFLAAQSKQADPIVKALIKAGAKVNKKSKYSYTALIKHVQLNRINAVKSLIKAKAKVNYKAKDGSTALYHAAKYNYTRIMNELIKARAKIDIVLHNGMTPLMKAASEGHNSAVRILLKHGANPERRDRKGYTSIEYAKWNGHKSIAKMLIKKSNTTQNNIQQQANSK